LLWAEEYRGTGMREHGRMEGKRRNCQMVRLLDSQYGIPNTWDTVQYLIESLNEKLNDDEMMIKNLRL
jgi:hypothetical protein